MNMVMLGAAAEFMNIKIEDIETAIQEVFERKGEAVVEMNLKAFRAGLEFSRSNR